MRWHSLIGHLWKFVFWNLFESVGTHVFCGNFSSFYGNNVKCYTWWYHAKRTLYGSRDVGEGSARLRESSMIRVCHTCSLGNCTHSTCRIIKTNLLRMQEIQDEDLRITVKFSLFGEHKWHVTSMNDERNLVINWLDCTSLTLNNLDYFFYKKVNPLFSFLEICAFLNGRTWHCSFYFCIQSNYLVSSMELKIS